ncbi:Bug family tripartite tricarboxylate transporter substrate binding protein [Neoroseomonas lacus]|nr:tripartite tricarboxylate transporter substrate binding protein [Neoroseomonas lacus]
MADELSAELKQPVIIDNRPGANGALGIQQLVAAPPDGNTAAMATLGSILGILTNPGATAAIPDIRPVALVATDVSVLAVPTGSHFTDISTLLNEAVRNPGRISYLRTGEASLAHLVVGCLSRGANADMLAVDYGGQPPGLVDLLARRIDLAVLNIGLAMPHIREGRLRPLAVVGAQRAAAMPDIPTLVELGFADANVEAWAMAIVRTGTPTHRLDALSGAFQATLRNDDVRARLNDAGVIPAPPGSAAEASLLLRRAAAQYGRVLAANGLRGGSGSAPDACRGAVAPGQ